MTSPENSSWFLDCPVGDVPVVVGDFPPQPDDLCWPPQGFNVSANSIMEFNGSLVDSDGLKDSGTRKRVRSESGNVPGSKACREKMRREKLNDRFLELGSILDPGKPPKMDKAAILSDAARMVTQLRSEAQQLKDSNENLQEKIKELKSEKNELRDEKQKLKQEKENLEQQVKIMSTRPSYIPHPSVIPAAAFAAQGQSSGHKLMMPVMGYPGFPMWQLMPPADVDISQDTESCSPVA